MTDKKTSIVYAFYGIEKQLVIDSTVKKGDTLPPGIIISNMAEITEHNRKIYGIKNTTSELKL